MSKAISSVTDLIFGKPKEAQDIVPEIKPPAVPAPSRREDSGANVVVGADAAKNARVSGRSGGGDVLGTRGRGSGLSV